MQSAPPSIADAASRELMGERIFWAGSPDRWAYAARNWRTALSGVPFLAFAIFWTYQVIHIPAKGGQGFSVFFPLWGLLFVLFGLSMLLSPLWAAWTAGNVYYVVTERRAVIFEKKFKLNIQSFPRLSVVGYDRVSSGGASGSIIFQRIANRSVRGTRIKEIGFIGLPDYAGAEQALNKLVANGTA
jgi:hypothetical protein